MTFGRSPRTSARARSVSPAGRGIPAWVRPVLSRGLVSAARGPISVDGRAHRGARARSGDGASSPWIAAEGRLAGSRRRRRHTPRAARPSTGALPERTARGRRGLGRRAERSDPRGVPRHDQGLRGGRLRGGGAHARRVRGGWVCDVPRRCGAPRRGSAAPNRASSMDLRMACLSDRTRRAARAHRPARTRRRLHRRASVRGGHARTHNQLLRGRERAA